MFNEILAFLSGNKIELLGFIAGVIYIIFSLKQNIWLWPFGILTSVVYVAVYFSNRIYADMGLSIYYVLISFYGWYHWVYGKKNKTAKTIKIEKLTHGQLFWILIIIGLIYLLIYFILDYYTNSDIPHIDAFTTAASIVATWMIARKIIENWLFWIVIDTVSVGLYIYKEIYLTACLYSIYGILAVFGYLEWKKKIEKSNE